MDQSPSPGAGAPRNERRAPQRRLYTVDQLLGRRPIRLRRRSDKVRLAVHAVATFVLCALTVWWVLPMHAFTGPVLFIFAPGRGVHVGDTPTLAFVAIAARSLGIAVRIMRRSAR